MKFYINNKAIILRVTGKDSRRYLNARLSNDIKILQPGGSAFAAALSPHGKTEGYFAILCISNEEFILTCDGGEKDEVIKAFRRYLVADRVEVTDLSSDRALASVFSDTVVPWLTNEGITIPSKRSKQKSYDIIILNEKIVELKSRFSTAGAIELELNDFRLLAVKAGLPSFPEELNQDIIFSASGLDFAVSFKKGCYVGQEVIEKIDAYGRVPYLLKAVSTAGRIDQIEDVKLDGQPLTKDKILPHYYDKTENKTYLFLELKNKDNILDSRISINNNEAQLIC